MNIKTILFYSSLLVLLIMHGVGFCGVVWRQMQDYRDLTWLNLLITFIVFIVGGSRFDQKYLTAAILLALAGFFIEVLGVKTKLIFGNYEYTHIMGTRFLTVPLIIGLNWSMLILSCAAIVNKIYSSTILKAATGASLMTLLDIVLEPIAFKYDYWQWDAKIIPLQNYVAWWMVSFIMLLAIFKFLKAPENKMGIWVFSVQLLFFCFLNLFG